MAGVLFLCFFKSNTIVKTMPQINNTQTNKTFFETSGIPELLTFVRFFIFPQKRLFLNFNSVIMKMYPKLNKKVLTAVGHAPLSKTGHLQRISAHCREAVGSLLKAIERVISYPRDMSINFAPNQFRLFSNE